MDIKHYISFYKKHNMALWITVNGESMTPTLKNKEQLLIRFSQKNPHIGDIVLFLVKEEYILHRVVNLLPNGLYVTKGDANLTLDNTLIKEEHIIGFAEVNCKSSLLISWATRLSYWQGKIFCHVMKKGNKFWMKLVYVFCIHFQHGYQWILKHGEIPVVLSYTENIADTTQTNVHASSE